MNALPPTAIDRIERARIQGWNAGYCWGFAMGLALGVFLACLAALYGLPPP